jgi:FMN phosphatase YigB (HAD superfamily)
VAGSAMSTGITTIVFDCFGVLVENSQNRFIAEHLEGDMVKIHRAYELDHAASRGEITTDDFIREFATMSGLPYSRVKFELEWTPKNQQLIDYICTGLSPLFTIGMVSNSFENLLDRLFTDEERVLFITIVLSCDVGVAKPDPEIFRVFLRQSGKTADECLFVDDVQENCDSAAHVGMHSLRYADMTQFRKEIGKFIAPI